MASPSTIASKSRLSPAPLALLPPLPLYRRLLRAHRKLPADMRLLGDEYVKSEFRAHREVENPIHIVGFLTEWQLYAQKLEGDSWVDEKLDQEKLNKMNDQQLALNNKHTGAKFSYQQSKSELSISSTTCFWATHLPFQNCMLSQHSVPTINDIKPYKIGTETAIAMCNVIRWKSPSCKHRWITIVQPCAADRGFNNCPNFASPTSRTRTLLSQQALPKSCPICDLKGDYDGNKTRIIKKEVRGVSIWAPGSKGSQYDMVCCSVM
ncbi:acetate non-utilizing protein 9 [Arachnomyces sp. PD_36]|nr:acetate non-utilizing protein 9 [Arachnomyces sp. PD_36]